MNLSAFGLTGVRRKALVVLGAGASRGASFVKYQVGAKPPLDRDFFQQLSWLSGCRAGADLIEFARQKYGDELELSMETFFSETEYTAKFLSDIRVDRGRPAQQYNKALDNFYAALAALLNHSASGQCQYHDKLALALRAGDSVLSFNYDCIMDNALRVGGGSRWDPSRGYGFEVLEGAEYWRPGAVRGRKTATPIQLLKMHGSVNWDIRNDGVHLERRDIAAKDLRGRVIAPTLNKVLAEKPFSDVWKCARRAVRGARAIVAIGYSVPQADFFARSLFKEETASRHEKEKIEILVLANPDGESRRRFYHLIRAGMKPAAPVIEFDSLNMLADTLLN
jgi:hypothetical protein